MFRSPVEIHKHGWPYIKEPAARLRSSRLAMPTPWMRSDISKGGGSDKGNNVNAEYLTDDKNYDRVIPLEVKEERRV
jgi:hypothetical protein